MKIKPSSFYAHRAYFTRPDTADRFLRMLDERGTRCYATFVNGVDATDGYVVSYGN